MPVRIKAPGTKAVHGKIPKESAKTKVARRSDSNHPSKKMKSSARSLSPTKKPRLSLDEEIISSKFDDKLPVPKLQPGANLLHPAGYHDLLRQAEEISSTNKFTPINKKAKLKTAKSEELLKNKLVNKNEVTPRGHNKSSLTPAAPSLQKKALAKVPSRQDHADDSDKSRGKSPSPQPLSNDSPPNTDEIKSSAPKKKISLRRLVRADDDHNSVNTSSSVKNARSLTATLASIEESIGKSPLNIEPTSKKLLSVEKPPVKNSISLDARPTKKLLKPSSKKETNGKDPPLKRDVLNKTKDMKREVSRERTPLPHSDSDSLSVSSGNEGSIRGDDSVVCVVCGKPFSSQFGLSAHMVKRHKEKGKRLFIPGGAGTNTVEEKVHPSSKKLFTNGKTGLKNADELSAMEGVVTTALPEKSTPFTDGQAENKVSVDEAMASNATLTARLSSKSNKPKYSFACSVCGKTYASKTSFDKYHLKLHPDAHALKIVTPGVVDRALSSPDQRVDENTGKATDGVVESDTIRNQITSNNPITETGADANSSPSTLVPSTEAQPQFDKYQDEDPLAHPIDEGFSKKMVTEAVNKFMDGNSSPRSLDCNSSSYDAAMSSSADSLDDGYMAADESNDHMPPEQGTRN